MFEIKLPSDMFDNVKNHIASTLFVARLKGNDGESFILVFEPAAQQSVQLTGLCVCPEEWSVDIYNNCSNCGLAKSPRN